MSTRSGCCCEGGHEQGGQKGQSDLTTPMRKEGGQAGSARTSTVEKTGTGTSPTAKGPGSPKRKSSKSCCG